MNTRQLIFVPLNFCLLSLTWLTPVMWAQTKPSAPSAQANSEQLRRQLEDVRKEFSDLRKEVDTLKSRVDFDEYILGTKRTTADTISLDLTSRNYQRLDTDNGFFLVSVEGAVPYLNGYKIQLRVGNPSYATYKDYKLKVKWSKSYDFAKYTKTSYDDWNKAIQEKEISFPGSLEAGSWNSVELILAPVTADQLGYLVLSLDASTVSLRTQ